MPRTRPPLERRVFREEIREKLIEDILGGRLAPGARIVETRIAQQLGVSQGPVREALRDLELLGFVVSSPFRGTQVRRISTDDLLEIYPIRAALEGVAARGAALRLDDGTIEELEETLSHMRSAAARDDAHAQAKADAAFHHIIIKASGNRMLEHVWQSMRLSITTCVTYAMTHRSLHEITERHVPLLEALRSRDPNRAEAEIRRHIEEPGDWIRLAARQEQERIASAGATRGRRMNPKAVPLPRRRAQLPAATDAYCLRQGILKLLAIKDSDVRLLSLEQCRDAVDKSLHAGGAFSATIPLVSLYYGGFIAIDVANPTRRGQDLFVLSKGHAVAALASIYAELGYFDRSVLRNSRSYVSILNGHPGPLLPGVHVATGPMGQGLAVAQGFAIAGRWSPRFDSYCITGDGELQEGPIWEAVMYAGQKHLDNFCVLVDRNNGQLDIANRMVFPMPELERVFESFDWQVHSVDATQYEGVYAALEAFKFGPRNGKPTAIICHGTKGHGALSDFLNKHKVTVPDATLQTEIALQEAQRVDRVGRVQRVLPPPGRAPGRRGADGRASRQRHGDASRRLR